MIKPMYLQSKGMSPFFLDTYKGMLYSYIILILYEINKLVQNKIGGIKMERLQVLVLIIVNLQKESMYQELMGI